MKLKENFTVKQAADFLQATFAGDPNRLITGINEIHKVVEGDLTFVDIEKYYAKALGSKAVCSVQIFAQGKEGDVIILEIK